MTTHRGPADTVACLLMWAFGAAGMVLLARSGAAFLPALAGSVLGLAVLAAGLILRRAGLLDLSIAPLSILIGAQDLDVGDLRVTALLLLPVAICLLAYTLAHHAIRPEGARAGFVVAKASPKLVAAVGLTLLLLWGLDQSASLVSARWAASLDQHSTAMMVATGALLLSVGAAITAVRIAVRRMQARRGLDVGEVAQQMPSDQ
jgi:hypothetical protein